MGDYALQWYQKGIGRGWRQSESQGSPGEILNPLTFSSNSPPHSPLSPSQPQTIQQLPQATRDDALVNKVPQNLLGQKKSTPIFSGHFTAPNCSLKVPKSLCSSPRQFLHYSITIEWHYSLLKSLQSKFTY
jgi:hypothetical protein